MRTRSKNGENNSLNPCAKSRASSISLCEIKTHSCKLSTKTDDMIKIHFEKFDSLTATKTGCHSEKASKVRHIFSLMNILLL